MATIKDIQFNAGNFVVTKDVGPPTQYPIAGMLRAADIPSLTQTQVAAITALSNLVVILVRTLIDRQVLDESFVDALGMDWDLEHLIVAIEQMGGSYHEPNLDDAGVNDA